LSKNVQCIHISTSLNREIKLKFYLTIQTTISIILN